MDFTALDILIPVVERGVPEDVLLLIGKLDREIGIVRRRRAVASNGRGVLAITITLTRGVLRLAIGTIAVRTSGIDVPRAVACQRRGVAVTVTSDRNALAVDRAAVALGAIARQAVAHREPGLALRPFANRFALALTDEADRLAIGGPFFLERLAVVALALPLAGRG
jgi:hypothetical protein